MTNYTSKDETIFEYDDSFSGDVIITRFRSEPFSITTAALVEFVSKCCQQLLPQQPVNMEKIETWDDLIEYIKKD